MQTEQQPKIATLVFLQTVSAAVTQLKQKLQQDYERVYPGLGEIIHLILDEEEAKAWELSLFPHLFLPDLVEVHVAKLGLQPAEAKHEDVVVQHRFIEMPTCQQALAYVDCEVSRGALVQGLQKPDSERNADEARKKYRGGAKGVETNLCRHRQTYETAECYRYRRTVPDETRAARGAANEESPRVDERRGRSAHYPFNAMNSKASTQRKSKS